MLDLSDRILAPGQAAKDRAIVLKEFAIFEKEARQKFFINSTDSFIIAIAPQAGGIDKNKFELQVDLEALKPSEKFKHFDAFKKGLIPMLNQIYAEAIKGRNKTEHFKGSDIWKYFNNELPYHLKKNVDNHLVVLTDGYFDFEQNATVLNVGKRYTDSRMLNYLRKDPNGLNMLNKPTEGLIPVAKIFRNLKVSVEQIKPKYPNLSEQDLLIALWKKWLTEMHIAIVCIKPAI